jgi:hypothetical protein
VETQGKLPQQGAKQQQLCSAKLLLRGLHNELQQQQQQVLGEAEEEEEEQQAPAGRSTGRSTGSLRSKGKSQMAATGRVTTVAQLDCVLPGEVRGLGWRHVSELMST